MACTEWYIPLVIALTSLVGLTTSRGCCRPDKATPNTWRCIGVTSISDQQIISSVQTLQIDCQNRSVLTNLTAEDFNGKTQLTHLTIENCRIESIGAYTFNSLDKLQSIELAWNSLNDIDADAFLARNSLAQVNKVDLSGNKLRTLPSTTFQKMQNVNEVYLRHNEINELDDNLFILPQLIRLLDLGENRLSSLSEKTFRHLRSVEYLYLDSNLLDRFDGGIFPVNSTLRVLNLSHNSINHISSFCQHLGDLREVFLDNNQLTEINGSMFEGCSNVGTLHLQNNRITSMSDVLVNLPRLYTLYLRGNLLSVVHQDMFSYSVVKNFGTLEMQDNVIAELKGTPFVNMPYLTRLNLSRNALKTLNSNALGDLRFLQNLDLGYNEIVNIEKGVFDLGTFESSITLGNIYLQGNVLTNVDSTVFNNITVGILDLTNTSIVLPADAFVGSTITFTFRCSGCSLRTTRFLNQLTNQDRLRTIDLSNQTHTLEVVLPEKVAVDFLSLNDNELDSLRFLENSSVRHLNLDRTNIKKLLPSHNSDTKSTYQSPTDSLYLRGNRIESTEEIASLLGYISALDISENDIQSLVETPNRLRYVRMDDNNASQPVNNSGFFVNRLDYLSLRGSHLLNLESTLDTTNTYILVLDRWDEEVLGDIVCPTNILGNTLRVRHAGLTNVPPLVRGHSQCQWGLIHLEYNKLTEIHREDFAAHETTLKFLNLSHNNIHSVEAGAFAFVNVETIDLSHNKLISIENLLEWVATSNLDTWMISGSSRRTLDLSYNTIQTVPAAMGKVVSEKAINIDFNPFHCNCEMSWLPGLICDDLLADLPAGSCSTPTKLAFSELVPEDVPHKCLPPNIVEIQASAIANHRVLLTCVAAGDPLPSISWFLVEDNGEMILLTTAQAPEDKSASPNIGSVTVSEADARSTTYVCEASAPGGANASEVVYWQTMVISNTTTTSVPTSTTVTMATSLPVSTPITTATAPQATSPNTGTTSSQIRMTTALPSSTPTAQTTPFLASASVTTSLPGSTPVFTTSVLESTTVAEATSMAGSTTIAMTTNDSNGKYSVGEMIGAIIGTFLIAVFICFLAFVIWKKRHSHKLRFDEKGSP